MPSAASISVNFPFSAVAGQSEFKLALILNAINPKIGGLLVTGPRGCAKSTLARGFADLLQDETDHQFVTLPLGASEEMLVGTLDLQKILNDQQVHFNPGLLAKAHDGVLYVDEVNLLNDGLVDLLLDVAASGINRVERDGISHQHAANFILLGTMNPDEGELRPQLSDRFGLCVQLSNQYSIEERVAIVQLREAFDTNPTLFIQKYQVQQQQIKHQIEHAKRALSSIECAPALRVFMAQRCHDAQVDGLRADIVFYRAAVAHAAWMGRSQVSHEDLDAIENLVLNHRREEANPPPNQPPQPKNEPLSNPFSRPENTQNSDNTKSDDSSTASGDWGQMAEPEAQSSDVTQHQLIMSPVSEFNALSAELTGNTDKASQGNHRNYHLTKSSGKPLKKR